MRLVKLPNGDMMLDFSPSEFHLLLQVLAGFDAEGPSRENLEQAKAEVIFAMLSKDKGNDTLN